MNRLSAHSVASKKETLYSVYMNLIFLSLCLFSSAFGSTFSVPKSEVKNQITRTKDRLWVTFGFFARYQKDKVDSYQVYDVMCNLKTNHCDGSHLFMMNGSLTLSSMLDSKLTKSTGNLSRIKWGLREIDVIIDTKKIRFLEEGIDPITAEIDCS